MLRSCLHLVYILLALTILPAYGANTPEEFISAQNIIRITTDHQPGFGNQAANASLMTRLRKMGFNGDFEFIYPDCVSNKITLLFDLPTNISSDYYDKKQKIRFIKMSEHLKHLRNNTVESAVLGMTGAFRKYPSDPIEDCELDASGINKLTLKNFSNFLNTSVTAAFDNYPPRSGGWSDTISIVSYNEQNSSHIRFDHQTFFSMPTSNLEDAVKYLENHPGGIEISNKNPGLKTFISGINHNDYNILAVYGFTVNKAFEENDKKLFPGNILQIIAAARYAQLNNSKLAKKPLIIPVFYDYESQANEIKTLMRSDNWGSYEQAGAAQARTVLRKLNLYNNEVFSVTSISKPESIEIIKNLKPNDILLLSMGKLPKVIFDGIYTYSGENSWPQIREGASAFDSLILTGRPHFRCRGDDGQPWEIDYDLVNNNSLKLRMQNLYGNFCHNMDDWANKNNVHQILGELILEANDSKSPISTYFQNLKAYFLKPENDRVHIAVTEALKKYNSKCD